MEPVAAVGEVVIVMSLQTAVGGSTLVMGTNMLHRVRTPPWCIHAVESIFVCLMSLQDWLCILEQSSHIVHLSLPYVLQGLGQLMI